MGVGERQRVEVLKVLWRGAKILVLDEPTAVLTPQESSRLLALVRALAQSGEGRAVVVVTHKLGEVIDVADRIVVLRRGAKVLEAKRGELGVDALAEAMVGGRVELPTRTPREAANGDEVLGLRGIIVARADGAADALRVPALSVRAGEIVGVAGVEGNGQAELIDVCAGLLAPSAGTVHLGGQDVTRDAVKARLLGGLAVIHADRQERGLVLPMSVAENLALGRAGEFTRRGVLARDALAAAARAATTRFDIRGGEGGGPVAAMSGGNQQKVVLAREIGRRHRALLAAHPTRGVDVGAIRQIRQALLAERDAGRGVLLVSTDLDELFALADRLVVLYRGRIVSEGPTESFTIDAVGRWMAGGDASPVEAAS
jgi:simple sugar transport system ATP-binding protein